MGEPGIAGGAGVNVKLRLRYLVGGCVAALVCVAAEAVARAVVVHGFGLVILWYIGTAVWPAFLLCGNVRGPLAFVVSIVAALVASNGILYMFLGALWDVQGRRQRLCRMLLVGLILAWLALLTLGFLPRL